MIQDLATYSIEEIAPLLGSCKRKTFNVNGTEYLVKMSSLKYRCFNKCMACVACGANGAYFKLEHQLDNKYPHLNMYTADGTLMTVDHLRPVSKGGKNSYSNTHTMCITCNNLKGSAYLRLSDINILKNFKGSPKETRDLKDKMDKFKPDYNIPIQDGYCVVTTDLVLVGDDLMAKEANLHYYNAICSIREGSNFELKGFFDNLLILKLNDEISFKIKKDLVQY